MTNNIKILHIAECAGGVDRYLEMLLPLLENEYEQIFICSYNYDMEKYQDIVNKVYQLDIKQTLLPFRVMRDVLKIRRILIKEKPVIVYCHSSFAGALGRLACIGLDLKIVYNPHGWAFNMVGRKAIVYKGIEKGLSKITDVIVCISKSEYMSAINNGFNKNKLRVIENGIDVKSVQNANPYSREELGIPANAYIVGMVGRLTPQKAPDVFIQAAKLINEQIDNAFFIIVGCGDEEDEIIKFARENNIHLLVTGWTHSPYSYLKLFDVALLLSRWEGFGLAVAEYMVAHKPIIATRVDAIPTLIEDNVDGFLVSVNSPKEVAQKVLYIYNNKEEMDLMTKKAYLKGVEKYDIHRVAEQHIKMFAHLISCKDV